MIDRCRAVLRAFAGLELVAVELEDGDELAFRFGPGGTRVLTSVRSDVEIEDGAYSRWTSGRFPPDVRDALLEAARALVGGRVAWLRHRVGGRLIVAFEDERTLTLEHARTAHDWSLWHNASKASLEAFTATDPRDPRPERWLKVFGDVEPGHLDGPHAAHGGLGRCVADGVEGWLARPADAIAAAPPPPRAWLAALTALALTAATEQNGFLALEFGVGDREDDPDGDGAPRGVLSLELANAGLEVRAGLGARRVRAADPFSGTDREAALAALAPLTGSRATWVEHHEDGRLELGFGKGATVAVLPSTEDEPLWSATDGATRRRLDAGWEDDLAVVGAREPWRAARALAYGSLGLIEAAPDPRPARPVVRPRRAAAATPRAIHPCSWVLGALIGKRLLKADMIPGTRKLRLTFLPAATVVADTCDVVIDDGRGTRTLFHRTDIMALSDQDAAVAAASALRGETVTGVEHGEDHRLTIALDGGGEVVLSPGTIWDHDWRVMHVATGVTLDGGPGRRLRLRGTRAREQTLRGELGSATGPAADRALLGAPWIDDARAMLRALVGLRVCASDALTIELGEPGVPGGMLVQNVWADLFVTAPGEAKARRLADNDRDGIEAAFARLHGVRVHEVRHAAPGVLALAFADGNWVVLAPARVHLPVWTAYYGARWQEGDGAGHPSPRVDAFGDGSLRARDVRGERGAKVYGALGPLPAYGFRS